MKIIAKLLLIFIIFIPCALANEAPASIQNSFRNPHLIGSSNLKYFGINVYKIFLWSENEEFSYNRKFAIQIIYNMNFSVDELAERSIDEIKRLHILSAQEEENYFQQLKTIFRPIKKGDQKVALFTPNKGVTMFHNNVMTGKIRDQKLARLFVDIWLDERGSYPEMTKEMLGKVD